MKHWLINIFIFFLLCSGLGFADDEVDLPAPGSAILETSAGHKGIPPASAPTYSNGYTDFGSAGFIAPDPVPSPDNHIIQEHNFTNPNVPAENSIHPPPRLTPRSQSYQIPDPNHPSDADKSQEYADYPPITSYSNKPPDEVPFPQQDMPSPEYEMRSSPDANRPDPTLGGPLPSPYISPKKVKSISLQEAIALALRNNPDVLSDELDRVTQKFDLEVAHNQFEPTYTFDASTTYTRGSLPTYDINPTVNLTTPIGTTLSASYDNDLTGGPGQLTLTGTQPILRGFGWAINTIDLANSLDTERINQLAFKFNIIGVVVDVITAYRQLVEDYNSLAIQERTVKENEDSVKQYKLQLQYGKIARSDLLQQQATLESDRLSLIEQESSLQTDYYAFLQTLGLDPNAKLQVNRTITMHKYRFPSLKECIQIALNNDQTYQGALLTLLQDERATAQAKDNMRWQLNLTATETLGFNGTPPDPLDPAGNGAPPNFGFSLNIPIDDMNLKQSLLDARVAEDQQKITVEQDRQTVLNNVTTSYSLLEQDYQQVIVSVHVEELQQATYNAELIKYKYGKSSALNVSQQQDTLLSDQLDVVEQKIAYLNQVTSFEQTLGITLDRWQIKLRY